MTLRFGSHVGIICGALCSLIGGLGASADQDSLITSSPSRDQLVSAAATYAAIQSDAQTFQQTQFSSLGDIDAAMANVAALDAPSTASSWSAYAALTAMQTPEFVSSILQAANDYGHDAMANGFRVSPTYAAQMPGSDAAKTAIYDRLTRDGLDQHIAAASIKAQAYDLQSQGWAAQPRRDKNSQLAALANQPKRSPAPAPQRVDHLVTRPLTLSAKSADLAGLSLAKESGVSMHATNTAPLRSVLSAGWRAVKRNHADRPAPAPSQSVLKTATIGQKIVREQNIQETADKGPMGGEPGPRMQTAMDQALTLAALTILQVNQPADIVAQTPKSLTTCLNTATLHLQQCVAVSRFGYEDPFCIAEHGLNDVSMCFTQATYTR